MQIFHDGKCYILFAFLSPVLVFVCLQQVESLSSLTRGGGVGVGGSSGFAVETTNPVLSVMTFSEAFSGINL
jgi:hypothetical protein